jgi:hypothetical protein
VILVGAPPASDQFSPEFEIAGTRAPRRPDAKPYDVRPLAQRRSAESKSMRRQYPALLAGESEQLSDEFFQPTGAPGKTD